MTMGKTMGKLCIYNRSAENGELSAVIVRKLYPDIELLGWADCDETPWDKILEADEIWLVGVTFYPWEEMRAAHSYADHQVIWIDNRQESIDAERDAESHGEPRFPGLRDAGRAVCDLTWEYCFPNEPMPSYVLVAALMER